MSVLEMFPVSILDKQLAELNLKEKPADHSNEFPFLIDQKTIDFIKKSKVLFINRGLPGSGKSTLASKIVNLYETTQTCSADSFFLDEQGNYNFDIEKRPQAHEVCKEKAKTCCSDSSSPIIIDNTNLMHWEIKYYLDLAHQHDYLVLIIEPRTPHKFDIHKLALINKHGVSLEALKQKLKQYQIILPYYFGWFLNLSDSDDLITQAKLAYEQALNLIPQFKKDLVLKTKKDNDFLKFHSGCLHCTSKFIGRHKHSDSIDSEYAQSEIVSLNMGKVFELKIVGFALSDKTMSAIVELDSKLWQNELKETDLDQFFSENKSFDKSNLTALKSASTAHITLATDEKTRNKYSSFDLLKINLLEIDPSNRLVKNDTDDKELIYFGDCLCFIKFKSPIRIDALFTGFYH